MPGSGKKKLKLLIITDTYVGGRAGSERYLYTLVTTINPEIFDIKIIQLMANKVFPYSDGPLNGFPNIEIESIPVGRIYGLEGLRALWAIRKDVIRCGYDIIQSVHEKADLINMFIPVRDARPGKISSRRDMGFKKGKLLRTIFGKLNARFDAVVAPSQAILDHLEAYENLTPDKLRLIRNGIERNKTRILTAGEKTALKKSLGLTQEQKVIGCVANLKAVKGHQYLLEAFVNLLKKHPETVLVLVGDGELRVDLEKIIQKEGIGENVRVLGIRDDVPDLLQIFDVAVSSSLSEGLSNALIEAAAAGVPIVATGVGGNPEIVRHQENGLIVPARDAAAQCDAICELLEDVDMAERFGLRGISLVENEFSLESIRHMYEGLYLGMSPGKEAG